ncbi:putative nuclease HARBI1 [Heterodontus francisci]|uniref:putative nuclease HARBI1 n=1 Tax=Heterodontus francisci TaxID=7792 RepID=UPI00355B3BAF
MAAEVSSDCVGGHPMPVALKVTVALNFYTSGSLQASTGDMCRISQSSAQHCIKVVTDAVFRRANQYIKFQTDSARQAEETRDFNTIAGFPMVQSVIDCTHMSIRAPAGQRGAFINQKRFHSMNVHLVCDHSKSILQVCTHYPGSSHAHSFSGTPRCQCLSSPVPGRMDTWRQGYPLKIWLMTPVRNPRNEAEERYNASHVTTRVTIEQTIGLLKMRFRCLDHSGGALRYSPARASRIVVVYCALHNLNNVQHKASSDEEGEEFEEEEEGAQPPGRPGEAVGGLQELGAREARQAVSGSGVSPDLRFMNYAVCQRLTCQSKFRHSHLLELQKQVLISAATVHLSI